ncbi:MAG: GDP-mannose 4,6-dehydratase [Leptonema sp. (in: Bacteria)]|nr:GDP-mannose 4,6-dehydratase [Leptonema sp. (in: bacteria)]
MKRALITGIGGQDGSYLTDLLLSKGYEVHGIVKRESFEDSQHRLGNLLHCIDKISLYPISVNNHLSLYKLFRDIQPDECYHLAASSFVHYNFDDEFLILNNNFNSTHYLLSTIKELKPTCRLFFAGSSEMFGEPDVSPQTELTRFNPKSIYGISKIASYYMVRNYREKEGLFACTGIMYNHESPRRGHQFVTRKITSTVAKIAKGEADHLSLGNLDALRDWGWAPDYVEAMWQMLQTNESDDYIVATGKLHKVRDFVDIAFSLAGLDYQKYVKTDERFFRPSEKIPLCGNPDKISARLNWHNTRPLEEVIKAMLQVEGLNI